MVLLTIVILKVVWFSCVPVGVPSVQHGDDDGNEEVHDDDEDDERDNDGDDMDDAYT